MLISPSEPEFLRLAPQGNLVPVFADLVADFATPVAVYARLRRGG
jgi:anthranilate synthase component 1